MEDTKISMRSKIYDDFIMAFKEKDKFKKDTLGIVKSKITEAEKTKSVTMLDDDSVILVIQSVVKQLKQTIDMYLNHLRNFPDSENSSVVKNLQESESQLKILTEYLPDQLTVNFITEELDIIFLTMAPNIKNLGKIMNYFREKYASRYDAKILKSIIDTYIQK